jgi:hypothetical protein
MMTMTITPFGLTRTMTTAGAVFVERKKRRRKRMTRTTRRTTRKGAPWGRVKPGVTPGPPQSPPESNRLKKQVKRTQDPLGIKPKRTRKAPLQLSLEERLTLCLGLVPPHMTDFGLGPGVPLPPPNPNGPRQIWRQQLEDNVLKKYGPTPAADRVPCMTCFCRMRIAPWHECHVNATQRVCRWCHHFEQKPCHPVGWVFILVFYHTV